MSKKREKVKQRVEQRGEKRKRNRVKERERERVIKSQPYIVIGKIVAKKKKGKKG